jgi:tetratricopeptide (TPR) repeat protein
MPFTMRNPGDQRQWRVIAAAAGVSAVLGVLATLLAIGYVRQKELREAAHQESLRARRAAADAREAANRGTRARDQAEELAGFLLDDLRDELYQLGRSDLLLAATERTVAYFDHLPPELVTPESQAKRASVLLTLSDARYQQGDYPGAIATARRSIELWKQLAADADPEGERTIRLGRAMGELALYQYQSDDPYAARATYAEMLRLYEDPNGRIKDAGWRAHGVAKVHLGLGGIERLAKNYPDARREFAEAIRHVTAALALKPDELSWIQMLMTAHNDTGVVCMHEKNYPAAEESFLRAVEPNRRLIRLEPKNRRWEKELATTLQNLGALMHLQKQHARAEPYLREALTLRQGLVDWDPKSTRARRKLAHSLHRMTLLQFDTGRNSDALASARSALAALRRLATTNPDDEEAIREIEEYTGKYCERLTKAGLNDAARQMIQETTAFAQANRTSKAGSSAAVAWDKLLASLREASTEQAPKSQLEP